MKFLSSLFALLLLASCDFKSSDGEKTGLRGELHAVVDSITPLMTAYHYNPAELATDRYREVAQAARALADTAQSPEAFIKGFNQLWADGPFSHVRLGKLERPAAQMADYIDTLRMGEGAATLTWEGETAVLTLNTMTGLDTREKVEEAYRILAENKAKALIIDLRNNNGGTFAGIPLIGHLLTDSLDAGFFVSRKWWATQSEPPAPEAVQELVPWKGWSIKSFWHDVQKVPLTRVTFISMEPHFSGPVYVLTSRQTASAAEFSADALAWLDAVTLIGETTAGEMLSQKMFDLPHGFQLSFPIAEYYSTRIGRIEGKGVRPDIELDPDAALDLALLLAGGMDREEALTRIRPKTDRQD